MAAAGLGDDLLLANEVARRRRGWRPWPRREGGARVTVAVDSDETIEAAAAAAASGRC